MLVAGLLAAIAGGVGPIVLPAATTAATASADHRLAEMASPSPFRGLVYDGLSLGRKGSACEGAFAQLSSAAIRLNKVWLVSSDALYDWPATGAAARGVWAEDAALDGLCLELLCASSVAESDAMSDSDRR